MTATLMRDAARAAARKLIQPDGAADTFADAVLDAVRSPLGNIMYMAVGEDASAPAPSVLHHCADAELGRRIRATIIEKPDGWTVPEQHFNGAPSLETLDDVIAAQVKP